MAEYRVNVPVEGYSLYTVEANSEEEAILNYENGELLETNVEEKEDDRYGQPIIAEEV